MKFAGREIAWLTVKTMIVGLTIIVVGFYSSVMFIFSCRGAKLLKQFSLANDVGVHCQCDPHPDPSCFP